jgi:hypothetical protein
MSVQFHGNFGETKKRAVFRFVKQMREKATTSESPRASTGPEGQILVFWKMPDRSASREQAVRRAMAKVSQEVLNTCGVWIVGSPEKSDKHRKKSFIHRYLAT